MWRHSYSFQLVSRYHLGRTFYWPVQINIQLISILLPHTLSLVSVCGILTAFLSRHLNPKIYLLKCSDHITLATRFFCGFLRKKLSTVNKSSTLDPNLSYLGAIRNRDTHLHTHRWTRSRYRFQSVMKKKHKTSVFSPGTRLFFTPHGIYLLYLPHLKTILGGHQTPKQYEVGPLPVLHTLRLNVHW